MCPRCHLSLPSIIRNSENFLHRLPRFNNSCRASPLPWSLKQARRRSTENHRSCSCNGMFAVSKYSESPRRVVMSKDSVGIRYKRKVKSDRARPFLFRDTRKLPEYYRTCDVEKCEIVFHKIRVSRWNCGGGTFFFFEKVISRRSIKRSKWKKCILLPFLHFFF